VTSHLANTLTAATTTYSLTWHAHNLTPATLRHSINYYYYYYIQLMAFFQDNLGKPAPER